MFYRGMLIRVVLEEKGLFLGRREELLEIPEADRQPPVLRVGRFVPQVPDLGAGPLAHEVDPEELVERTDLAPLILRRLFPDQVHQMDPEAERNCLNLPRELLDPFLGPRLGLRSGPGGSSLLLTRFTRSDGGQETLGDLIRHDALLSKRWWLVPQDTSRSFLRRSAVIATCQSSRSSPR